MMRRLLHTVGRERAQMALVVAICAMAAALRFLHLDGPLWGDETATWAFARQCARRMYGGSNHPRFPGWEPAPGKAPMAVAWLDLYLAAVLHAARHYLEPIQSTDLSARRGHRPSGRFTVSVLHYLSPLGDIAAFEYLNRYATLDDLIVVDPWYMHDMVDYYFGGPAPMVGYDPAEGWIDVEAMQASGTWGLVPLDARPAPGGNIYVFYRRQLKWAGMFPNTPIVVYDPATASWYRYAENE
jgi:hypothetical protein